MDDASGNAAARFRPTWRQALGRGAYLGAVVSLAGLGTGLIAVLAAGPPRSWWWSVLAFGPLLLGAAAGLLLGRRLGVEIDAGGIRTVAPFASGVPWSAVVDMRAERRGARTVVSVYLDTGASVQLRAPYSGGLFAADPRFELKVFALSHLWRSYRFGGLAG
jgi:hypothetical protein